MDVAILIVNLMFNVVTSLEERGGREREGREREGREREGEEKVSGRRGGVEGRGRDTPPNPISGYTPEKGIVFLKHSVEYI